MASVRQNRWDWPGAEREYQRAIELNPSYATVHHWYAFLLMAQQRVDEAIAQAKQALELDPLSISINRDLALILLYARQPDQAIEQYEKTIELDPTFALAHQGLGRAYLQKGVPEVAIQHIRRAAQLSADSAAIALPRSRTPTPWRATKTRPGRSCRSCWSGPPTYRLRASR